MKVHAYLILSGCLIFSGASAQNLNDDFHTYFTASNKLQKKGLTTLGIWGGANLISGLALGAGADGSDRYFHQMNAGWGGVNLALSGIGLWQLSRAEMPVKPGDLYQNQARLHNILIFNAGLDIGYIATGMYLRERSRRPINDQEQSYRLSGFGNSLILQGAFLFGFDVVMFIIHKRHSNKKLIPLLNHVILSPTGAHITIPLGEF